MSVLVMSDNPQAYQEWMKTVVKKMPHLSKSQARGGIPVAWKIVVGNAKGSWKPYWLGLLHSIEAGIEDDWFVIVTTDPGLYAKWFYQAIVELGWHPLMRINHQGYYQLSPHLPLQPLSNLITQVGQSWSGQVNCFETNTLNCTLLANWEAGYADPWLMLTDLTPQQAQCCWYTMRSWIECLFKDIKRGGFGWHHTKMTDPTRAERLKLAMAVATMWLVSVGGQAEADKFASGLPSVGEIASSTSPPLTISSQLKSPTRFLSCFRRGFLTILASFIQGMPLPLGKFIPDFSPATG